MPNSKTVSSLSVINLAAAMNAAVGLINIQEKRKVEFYQELAREICDYRDEEIKSLLKEDIASTNIILLSAISRITTTLRTSTSQNEGNSELSIVEDILNCFETIEEKIKSTKHKQKRSIQTIRMSYDITAIANDLIYIDENIGKIYSCAGHYHIIVTTEPITLHCEDSGESLDLGRFEIKITLPELTFNIKAITPNYSYGNDSYVHPHVSGGKLCLGDAKPIVKIAMQQNRICDLIDIVKNTLIGYDADSAYLEIIHWYGDGVCRECNESLIVEDSFECPSCEYVYGECCVSEILERCNSCHTEFCHDCLVEYYRTCDECGEAVCDDCYTFCDNCNQIYCSSCTTRCSKCNDIVCCNAKECNCSEGCCEDCVSGCSSCSNNICGDCGYYCESCEGEFCESCYNTEKDMCSRCVTEEEEENNEE